MSSRDSPEMIFDLMGFGRDPARVNLSAVEHHLAASFGPSLAMVADALALPLDDIVAAGAVAVALQTVEIAAGTIAAGTVAAQKIGVSGIRQGRPLLRFLANWYLTTEVDPAWDLRETGWHLLVEGDMPLDVQIRFPVPLDQWGQTSPGLTAHRPVNAVPYVCESKPGIRTTADLPQIIPKLA